MSHYHGGGGPEEEEEEDEKEMLKDFQAVEDNVMVLIDARPTMLAKDEKGEVREGAGCEGGTPGATVRP